MKELIIALDAISKDEALEIARNLVGKVWGFKVNDLLLQHGVSIIKDLHKYGDVFADPKLHDTPNTVFNCVENLGKVGTEMVTVHWQGGLPMLEAAHRAAVVYNVQIAAVTTLTSMTDESVREIYRGFPLQRISNVLANSKVRTVVCAGKESETYRALGYKTIVPGFRPFGSLEKYDDQKRQTNIVNANYLVVGRPVVQHQDPVAAVKEIQEKMRAYGTATAIRSKSHGHEHRSSGQLSTGS